MARTLARPAMASEPEGITNQQRTQDDKHGSSRVCFRKDSAVKAKRPSHDQLTPSIQKAGGRAPECVASACA
eukprot:scaffold79194_cov31-Tisochrysis_lutea.AAC.3